ncbi:MAG: discoidin domain-containing protein [Proteobacteria bacterium]|jgi:hypothetical protein|nr:discoidin domain-containing protein [Pseudomonadota bacterium]
MLLLLSLSALASPDCPLVSGEPTASSFYSNGVAAGAFDGTEETMWNAGAHTGWVQLNLPSEQWISAINLTAEMTPNGAIHHEVLVDGQQALTIKGEMETGGSYDFWLEQPVFGKSIRIATHSNPSWAAWREIRIYSCTVYAQRGQAVTLGDWAFEYAITAHKHSAAGASAGNYRFVVTKGTESQIIEQYDERMLFETLAFKHILSAKEDRQSMGASIHLHPSLTLEPIREDELLKRAHEELNRRDLAAGESESFSRSHGVLQLTRHLGGAKFARVHIGEYSGSILGFERIPVR